MGSSAWHGTDAMGLNEKQIEPLIYKMSPPVVPPRAALMRLFSHKKDGANDGGITVGRRLFTETMSKAGCCF